MKISVTLFFLFPFFMLTSCDMRRQNAANQEALQEERQNRIPKKLSEGQLMEETYRQGRQVSQAAQESLLATLQAAIQRQGLQEAVQYCNLKALPLMDSLSTAHNARVRRTSLQVRNPENTPTELEEQLLQAYQYNVEQGLPLEDNVQPIDQQYMLYSKPIVLGNELCMNCHGQAGQDIAAQTLALIDSLYPGDQAKGYQKGDLRGMWSIRFRKKDIANAL